MTEVSPSLWFVDQVAAVIIAVFMLKVAYNIIKPSFMEICERGVDREQQDRIREMIEDDPDVREVHKIRTRHIGSEVFVDLHMLVDRNMAVEKAHDIAERMHKRVISSFPRIVDVVIHIEPYLI
jgi:cation diffusion facilitator family transporter